MLYEVITQIRSHVDYNSRIQLIQMLFGVANADGHIPDSEKNVIGMIASGLGISAPDFQSVMNMYVKNTDSAFV